MRPGPPRRIEHPQQTSGKQFASSDDWCRICSSTMKILHKYDEMLRRRYDVSDTPQACRLTPDLQQSSWVGYTDLKLFMPPAC
ncbi:hypothetical protein J1614_010690 [Plenodomus biglobosus]|nr:hypothetical protein J1614_010690 [Plenodomus biglobosus]